MTGDPFGTKSGTNTNFNRNNINTGGTKKFDENEINEAKESLKLLKMKMGNNLGGNNTNTNNFDMGNNTGNGNYRKPFKPNFGGGDNHEDQIKMESTKKVMGGGLKNNSNNNIQNNQMSYGNSKKNLVSNTSNTSNTKNVGNKNVKMDNNLKNNNFHYEEVVDDRPAIAGQGNK